MFLKLMKVCLIFLKVKNTHDVISNGIYEMTSSLEKTRDFENRVNLKKWVFFPMTSSMRKSRDFENRVILKKRVFFQ